MLSWLAPNVLTHNLTRLNAGDYVCVWGSPAGKDADGSIGPLDDPRGLRVTRLVG